MPSIATYLRLRPSTKPSPDFEVTEDEPNVLKVKVPKSDSQDADTTQQFQYNFRFATIFPMDCSQEDVFTAVGERVCKRFLEGYNCTIFAYGQTGSGKTFTIEGTSAQYEKRGLLPRCLDYIYSALKEQEAEAVTVAVTYLEIYNDTAYDLLNASSGANARLPKVSVSDRGTSCVVHNLTQHPAPSLDVAQNLVFMGRTNRTVASTSMNLTSSRSHSVFTLHLSFKRPGADTIVKAKLNLVDLAGSERVSKSHAAGQRLQEAKHINLSLHYLEAVIIALQQQSSKGGSKKHIPYRNSLLTKLLRDSLGGNCLTAMVATISSVQSNKSESVSTCRFAQRVALVDNDARRNEVLDDKTIIKRLRRRVAELQAELSVAQELAKAAKGSEEDDGDTPIDRAKCANLMKAYVHGKVRDPLAAVTQAKALRYCFDILRQMVLEQRAQVDELETSVAEGMKNKEQLQHLRQKFGVAKARMRNLESRVVKPTKYGRSPTKGPPTRTASKRSGGSSGSSTATSSTSKSSSRSMTRSQSDASASQRSQSKPRQRQARVRPEQHRQQQAPGRRTKKKQGVNKTRAQRTLVLLGRKEQELLYALEDISDKVEAQRQVVNYCQKYAQHRYQSERMREREMQEDQAQLAAQVIEIQNGRLELEDALGLTFDDVVAEAEASSSTSRRTATSASEPRRPEQAGIQRSKTFAGASKSRSSAGPAQMEEDPELLELKRREQATKDRLMALKRDMQADQAKQQQQQQKLKRKRKDLSTA
eukprot:m.169896 g.169896  ORF g.169896 m.169896 type:complete len:760 (-) comp14513_c1_seq3:2610-4889(-)